VNDPRDLFGLPARPTGIWLVSFDMTLTGMSAVISVRSGRA
jgi:hypothetical protein